MANLKRWEIYDKENMFPFCQQPSSGSSTGSSSLKKSTKIGRRTSRIPLQDITHLFINNNNDYPAQICSAPSPNSTAHGALELKKQCQNGTVLDRGLGLKSSCNARSKALRKGFR